MRLKSNRINIENSRLIVLIERIKYVQKPGHLVILKPRECSTPAIAGFFVQQSILLWCIFFTACSINRLPYPLLRYSGSTSTVEISIWLPTLRISA